MSDVARLAGVSIKTVSNVINDYPYIRDGTRQRVVAAIAQLDYHPNLSARSLRSGRSGVIGLAVPNLSLAYFAQLADEVIQAAEGLGLVVQVEQTSGDREREIEMLRSPRLRMTDGLILSPIGLDGSDVRFLNIETPLVLLGDRIFGGPVDHVVMQNIEGAQAAVDHLIAIGRRRIISLGLEGSGTNSSTLRQAGYLRALAASGIEIDERLIVRVDAGDLSRPGARNLWTRSSGAAAMRTLDPQVPFDAIFAMNDELALGAMRVMLERGLRVPVDVAVIGFDDIIEGQYSIPSLSTIDPGHREIAQTAVRVLVERIDENADSRIPPRELTAGFSLVVRESTVS